ncbi:unnamed protein product [Cyclocybe aegerita]|uniref:Uncharacterized protein n=1 Tax=Cyclocybe aegerita TaxID=1973307 RepID=A0A8S0VX78_CYCAE|nr:unnamed protein product [Cyclocybe aegerita]
MIHFWKPSIIVGHGVEKNMQGTHLALFIDQRSGLQEHSPSSWAAANDLSPRRRAARREESPTRAERSWAVFWDVQRDRLTCKEPTSHCLLTNVLAFANTLRRRGTGQGWKGGGIERSGFKKTREEAPTRADRSWAAFWDAQRDRLTCKELTSHCLLTNVLAFENTLRRRGIGQGGRAAANILGSKRWAARREEAPTRKDRSWAAFWDAQRAQKPRLRPRGSLAPSSFSSVLDLEDVGGCLGVGSEALCRGRVAVEDGASRAAFQLVVSVEMKARDEAPALSKQHSWIDASAASDNLPSSSSSLAQRQKIVIPIEARLKGKGLADTFWICRLRERAGSKTTLT